MTTPVERTRSLRHAWELLSTIVGRPEVPEGLRDSAISVLRHFPRPEEIANEAQRGATRSREAKTPFDLAWLMPEPTILAVNEQDRTG